MPEFAGHEAIQFLNRNYLFEFCMDNSVPFLIRLPFQLGFASEEEPEDLISELGDLLLNAILPDGHRQSPHGDVLPNQGQNALEVEDS